MLLITDLSDIASQNQPCGLTIGSFDGVHLGHQALLKRLRSKLPSNGVLTVFTFSNHPSHLFTPESPIQLICPPLQKVKHLVDLGVEIIFLIPFTTEFAKTPFENFLKLMKQRLQFSQLLLGSGATFGKNREGKESNVAKLAESLHFECEYMQKYLVNGTPVSSGRIRTLISQANFSEIQDCLGRPYSLMGRILEKDGHNELHFPGICLPPSGHYPIRLRTHSQTLQGTAHLNQKHSTLRLDIPKDGAPLTGNDAECIFLF